LRWDDPNLRWGDPSFLLEPGDAGYVPPVPPLAIPPKKKRRKYMASNPTPKKISKLIAVGEDMADGIHQHEAGIGIVKNTEALFRPKLEALIAAENAFKASLTAQGPAYVAEQVADSNVRGFIAAFIKTASATLGNEWSNDWVATGLPGNSVSIPSTKDARFTCIGTMKQYLTDNPDMEVSTPKITVTAAKATQLHTALSDARNVVANALSDSAAKELTRDAAEAVFRKAFRSLIGELEELLADDDPKWYDFGLNRPADAAQPDVPEDVTVELFAGGNALVKTSGARRASSFDYYKRVVGVDAQPVKVDNTEAEELLIPGLPVGATVEFTITGVNDAGEGQPSAPVSVVIV
jgi:hypothetical protein